MTDERPIRQETLDRTAREQQRYPNARVEPYTGIGKLSGVQHDSVLVTDPITGLPIKFIYDDQMEEGKHPDD